LPRNDSEKVYTKLGTTGVDTVEILPQAWTTSSHASSPALLTDITYFLAAGVVTPTKDQRR
jgi:hypothetical protein